ncbi:sporulation protein YqfD [Desulfofarcimen acetoxidans DSM 771]|uniref:Sporulation protein YqfD n=1 Tax=Desulfofarcimen acetoxidans (strain ATCC 49208 / DSM 771 / KCTC 5769 / VKM B-1644 / 5575) TaxID=485916 RepID=C8W3N7_DESAS|nr:sporulation protein YqfD [Desulfofarcimen acetoxidans]ACV63823.1 sporulation protein YqfD [Desulfofarcimen acetoxidans DSM 771]
MFLFKLLSFLIGHVSLVVRGESLEKFINMAVSRGIYLWDITRLEGDRVRVKVRLSAINPLRHIARQTGSRFYFQERAGMPFLAARLKRRKMLLAGAIIFVVSLYSLTSFIWFIEVTGTSKISNEAVLRAAKNAGLKRGVLKWNLDTAEFERDIREQLPEISWTGIEIKGTKAIIEIVEKKLPETSENQPAHIVASKEGLVKEVLVLVGNPLVKEGDTVFAGQILISGVIPPTLKEKEIPEQPLSSEQKELLEKESGEPKIVHAKGTVRARVWYESSAEAAIIEQGQKATGKTVSRFGIKIGAKEIILMGKQKIPFKQYKVSSRVKKLPSWRNINLPVEIVTLKYFEIVDFKEERGRAGAKILAERRAMEKIVKQLPANAVMQKRKVEEASAGSRDKNLVRVNVSVETLEDISEKRTFKPE